MVLVVLFYCSQAPMLRQVFFNSNRRSFGDLFTAAPTDQQLCIQSSFVLFLFYIHNTSTNMLKSAVLTFFIFLACVNVTKATEGVWTYEKFYEGDGTTPHLRKRLMYCQFVLLIPWQ